MTKEEYLKLYEKSLDGNCTPAELEALREYNDDFVLVEGESIDRQTTERLYNALQTAIVNRKSSRKYLWWKRSAAAAAIVLLCSLVFLRINNHDLSHTLTNINKKDTVIVPGSNKATLTLSDGSTVVLNDAQNGQIASENGTEVLKQDEGALSYVVGATPTEQTVFNTITIPRGGQYSLVLPDGSKVWLNADSKLKFPTQFIGANREVELEGEGYFEIAKNKEKPFYVRANGVKVKVLGTHFNLMAYRDEPLVRTTLLEGKVLLSGNGQSVYLYPGQQGVFSAHKFKVSPADIQQDLAWKNGYFIFNEENLTSIMRKISRWYDVDIDIRTPHANLTYTGSVSRTKNINEVLKVLSLTGTVKFKIEERRITVTN